MTFIIIVLNLGNEDQSGKVDVKVVNGGFLDVILFLRSRPYYQFTVNFRFCQMVLVL